TSRSAVAAYEVGCKPMNTIAQVCECPQSGPELCSRRRNDRSFSSPTLMRFETILILAPVVTVIDHTATHRIAESSRSPSIRAPHPQPTRPTTEPQHSCLRQSAPQPRVNRVGGGR